MGATDHESESAGDGRGLRDLSRRVFLQRSAMTAAAIGVVGSVPGLSGLLAGSAAEAPAVESGAAEAEGEAGALSQPLLAHVKDLSTGEISLFQGEREIVIRDPAIARSLFSAARR
jgi:hypothetical protein